MLRQLLTLPLVFFAFSSSAFAKTECVGDLPGTLKFKIKHSYEDADWNGRYNTETSLVENIRGKELVYGSVKVPEMIFGNMGPYTDEYQFSSNRISARDGFWVEFQKIELMDSGMKEHIIAKLSPYEHPYFIDLACEEI